MNTIEPVSLKTLKTTDYASLIKFRIRKILMICSNYDAFILEEDGQIETQIYREYIDLNLSNPPRFVWATTSADAERIIAANDDIDMVICMYNAGDKNVFSFAAKLKEKSRSIPFVLLTHFSKEIYKNISMHDTSGVDYVFSWHGNTELIVAIIKLFEDLANAAIRRGLRIWQDEVGHEEAESLHMRRSIKVEGRVKLVHIEDTDVVACGGIHASSTSELLEVSYVSQERIRGHVRTEWKCAEDAVAFRRSNRDIVSSLSALLSAEPGKVLEEAGRMRDEIADLKREAKKLERKAAEAVVAAEGDGPAVIFTELLRTQGGLGYGIFASQYASRWDLCWGYIFMAILVGVLIFYLVELVQHLVIRWKSTD